jgi:PAS domain S-box-containing protein
MSEPTSRDSEQLREENEWLRGRLAELRARLKEPEEILRAIRQGEVDAFVVSEPTGEHVYSLRSPDALYRVMVEDMKEGAVALLPSGVVLYCNRHFARMMKVEREAVLGGSIRQFVPDESRPFFAALEGPPADGTAREELALQASDGALVPVYVTASRIPVEGQDALCLIVADLTERKRQEELIAEARRKDEFLAMLAHELRNPLAPIRNAIQVLNLKGPGDPELQYARGVIERQVTQLTRLVDDLLDVSRITRGKVKLRLEEVDLAGVIARAVETARPVIDARRHELTIALPPGPLRVRGDVTRLSQILGNLLNNAAKFTPEGGQVRVAVESRGGEALIRVRDSGEGIPADMITKVFDLFTQVDTTVGRSQGGLGIGLTLVRSLVEMHGGAVAVHSDGPGKGSEFTVRLPLLTAPWPGAEGGRAAAPRAPPPGAPRRVLVVDDSRDAADSLALLLRCWGHEVRTASNGPAALAEAASFRPHVVLLDIGLPGMSGLELARKLRQLPGLEGVALVALTGFGRDDDRRRSLEAGCEHHWVKPVDPVVLESLLNAHAARA